MTCCQIRESLTVRDDGPLVAHGLVPSVVFFRLFHVEVDGSLTRWPVPRNGVSVGTTLFVILKPLDNRGPNPVFHLLVKRGQCRSNDATRMHWLEESLHVLAATVKLHSLVELIANGLKSGDRGTKHIVD